MAVKRVRFGGRSGGRRALAAVAIAAAGAVFLAACTGTSTPSTPTPSNNLSGITCNELVPAPVRDALHADMKAVPGYKPDAGTYPAKIVSLGGIACQWKASDGIALSVAAAHLGSADLRRNQRRVAASSTATIDFGASPEIRGYTANTGGTYSGDMEVFSEEGYWLSAESPQFFGPEDAESVIASMLQAIPSG